MADQLEEIKAKIDIISLISEYLPLKKTGRNFKALCPFHAEKSPSFIVSPERQIWHCFGCQRGGDIFGFLMAMENLEFPEALEILAKRAGIKLVKTFQASEQAKIKERIFQINHLASEFYHYLLLNHKSGQSALDYVLGRGVNKKSLETFSLGWAPNSWDSLMKFLTKKGFNQNEIESAGLIIKSSTNQAPGSRYYDRFRARLMFTLKDQRGNVLGFAGRTLDPQATEAKYINSPETPVYIKGNVLYGLDVTKEAIKKEDKVVIVEGEFDLISSFQAGVANIVAIKGSALTEAQVNLLKRYTQNISLALDMDLAGEAAARRGIEVADRAGLTIKVVKLPQGKDPDECARTGPGLWQKAVTSAVPVFDYILDSAGERFGADTAEGKKKIADEVIPVIAKITNPIVQAHYLSKLANLLAVSEEVVVETAKKMTKQQELGKVSSPAVSTPKMPRKQFLEEELLAIILQSEEAKLLLDQLSTEELPLTAELFQEAREKIFLKIQEYLSKESKFKMTDFVKTLPMELVPIADRLYLFDLGELVEDRKLRDKESRKIMVEIRKVSLKEKLLALSQKLKETKPKEAEELSQEYRQAAAELKKYQVG